MVDNNISTNLITRLGKKPIKRTGLPGLLRQMSQEATNIILFDAENGVDPHVTDSKLEEARRRNLAILHSAKDTRTTEELEEDYQNALLKYKARHRDEPTGIRVDKSAEQQEADYRVARAKLKERYPEAFVDGPEESVDDRDTPLEGHSNHDKPRAPMLTIGEPLADVASAYADSDDFDYNHVSYEQEEPPNTL